MKKPTSKLYLLRPVEGDLLWEPWYDKIFGLVIRAKTKKQARKMASLQAGYETADAWLNPAHSTCKKLNTAGKDEIVICDYHSALKGI
jgi:hypothetical protein